MTETFMEYPITLSHPAFAPSKPIPVPGSQVYAQDGSIARQDYRGTPERYPPVTVRDQNEEEYYRAQGYERAGKMDPSAWVRAHADAPGVDYVPQKYPLWRDGQLIMTAQEDPEASEADFAPPPRADAPPSAAVSSTEADNLRAQMEAMNKQMAAMAEQFRAAVDENAKLKAEKDAESAANTPAPRGPGRPRKVPLDA